MKRRTLFLAVIETLVVAAFLLAGCGSSVAPIKPGVAVKGPIQRYYVHGPEASKNVAPKTLVQVHHGRFNFASRPAVPNHPLGPTGSYPLVYADNFAAQIGSGAGQDSGWKANNHTRGCCNNGDEIATELESMVRTSAAGLEVNCVHESNNGFAFTCGGTDSDTPNGFKLKYASGTTFVVQVRMKWPLASECGQDPGAWISGPKWTDELDLAEGWGWNPKCVYSGGVPVWIYQTPSSTIRLQCSPWEGCGAWVPNPDTEEHTYTTVIEGTTGFTEYIDGKNRGHVTGANANTSEYVHLIFTHALREASGSTPPRLNGTSVFHVSYVAVYENGSGNIEHGGIAPGTTVEGSTPPPPTTETTPPPPPPTTETTPPPPPPSAPAVPTGCKAEGFLEGTTAKTRASCNAPPSGVSIEWQRTGPWTCSAGATPRYPIWTTGNPITNSCAVERGKRYDWSARAHNSTGTSAWTTPLPAYTP